MVQSVVTGDTCSSGLGYRAVHIVNCIAQYTPPTLTRLNSVVELSRVSGVYGIRN